VYATSIKEMTKEKEMAMEEIVYGEGLRAWRRSFIVRWELLNWK
jgi:hypothetical protein